MKNWKKITFLCLLMITAGVFAFADGLNNSQISSDASLLKKIVLYGVVPLIVLVITLKVFFLNKLIYFGLNIIRAYLAFLIIKGTAPSLPIFGNNIFTITTFGFGIFTAFITLYRFGASAVTNDVHGTGELEWAPLDNGSAVLREHIAGDSAVGNFLTCVFGSCLYGGIMIGIMMFVQSRWGEMAPCYVVIALSAWNILKNIIGIIKHR